MAAGDKPAMRVKLKSKDGSDLQATNRDGSTYKGPTVEFMTVWDNDGKLSANLAKDFAITFKGKPVKECWVNIYKEDGKGGAGRKPARRDASDDGDDF